MRVLLLPVLLGVSLSCSSAPPLIPFATSATAWQLSCTGCTQPARRPTGFHGENRLSVSCSWEPGRTANLHVLNFAIAQADTSGRTEFSLSVTNAEINNGNSVNGACGVRIYENGNYYNGSCAGTPCMITNVTTGPVSTGEPALSLKLVCRGAELESDTSRRADIVLPGASSMPAQIEIANCRGL